MSPPATSTRIIPRATYRLQFNETFRLRDAIALVPYWADLGISHLYASPLFQATPHSTHGYDVNDFNRLNPEIGTATELEQLVVALRDRQMGLVLDIVPNHMGIGGTGNAWWQDILKRGAHSQFAGYFDIEWSAANPQINGKVVVPVLGEDYASVVKKGEFKIEAAGNEYALAYYENRFPIAPESIDDGFDLKKINADAEALDCLIQRQHYFLTHWKNGDQWLNYRRFFSISTLAGLSVEKEEVFQSVHAMIQRWLKRGWLDGLRVDHVDGLSHPRHYLERLRKLAGDCWIVVEKIVQPGEPLPPSWPVDGTTGYDFLGALSGLFIDSASEAAFTKFYHAFTGEPTDYAVLVYEKKRALLRESFGAEIERLLNILPAESFNRDDLKTALIEIIARFPVYRNYANSSDEPITDAERERVQQAIDGARQGNSAARSEIFNFFEELLCLHIKDGTKNEFVRRFQQLTAPAMAKGVEDTAFYACNRFVALNEVGSAAGKFGSTLAEFADFCHQLQRHWPRTMVASSTHDTKRGEDVRARLSLLSEIPERWFETVRRWSSLNDRHWGGFAPDRNAEYLLYQSLAGAWPVSAERAIEFMRKAAREAKQRTNWNAPVAAYETALETFVAQILKSPEFTKDLENFCASLAEAAAINSLSALLVKMTVVGVPDFYQGTELWDLTLVDPDNRRAIDFKLRQQLLQKSATMTAREAWGERASGLSKLWLTRKILNLRRERPELFMGDADFEAVSISGGEARHAVAFQRGKNAIAVVQRFPLKRNRTWNETAIRLPEGIWFDEISGENFAGLISLEKLLQPFPVAFLTQKEII